MKLDMSGVIVYERESDGWKDSAYNRYINSPAWKEKREEALALAEHTCAHCGRVGGLLHVHHKTYIHFGHESQGDLQVLCVPCHKRADWARKWFGQEWESWITLRQVESTYQDWLADKGWGP